MSKANLYETLEGGKSGGKWHRDNLCCNEELKIKIKNYVDKEKYLQHENSSNFVTF